MLDYKPVTFLKGMIIIQDAVISFIEKIKDAKKLYKLIAFFAVTLVFIIIAVICSGAKITYSVKLSDTVLANVSSRSVYDSALEMATQVTGNDSAFADAKLQAVVTFNSKSASAEEVSQLLLNNSPAVCNGFQVKAGNKIIGYVADEEFINNVKDQRLASFNVEGAQCQSTFVDGLTITSAYFPIEKLSDNQSVKAAVDALDVKTVATTSKTYTVKNDTLTKKD